MPEGDSLHRLAVALAPLLVGKAATHVRLPRAPTDTAALSGQNMSGVEARGKNLLIHFEGGLAVHVHLKMHGRVRHWRSSDPGWQSAVRHDACVVELATQSTVVGVFHAPVARLLRSRDVVRDIHFRHLGPDLLSPTFDMDEALRRVLLRRHLPLGVALMEQAAVSGIGNVWKSEACFNQRLCPFTKVGDYGTASLRALLEATRAAMRQNVYAKQRTRPDPFSPPPWRRHARQTARRGEGSLSVYRRAGQPCFDCRTPIQVTYQGNPRRSTYYCPGCQAVSELPGRRPVSLASAYAARNPKTPGPLAGGGGAPISQQREPQPRDNADE